MTEKQEEHNVEHATESNGESFVENEAKRAGGENHEHPQSEQTHAGQTQSGHQQSAEHAQEGHTQAGHTQAGHAAANPLEQEIKALKEHEHKLMLALANSENDKKMIMKKAEEQSQYSISSFAKEMIAIEESLALAMQNASEEEMMKNASFKNFVVGIELTKNNLLKAFEKFGVVQLNPKGEMFDHNMHQAVSQVASPESKGTVIDVLKTGYTIKDRLLIPALVIVSSGQ